MSSVPAGKCPTHGRVWGDDVDMEFPVDARCVRDDCGATLETAGLIDEDDLPN